MYTRDMTGAIIPALMHRIPSELEVKRAWARVVLGWVTSWEGPRVATPFFFSYPRTGWHKGNVHARHDGCDHTSTNAPDPIRTPKLSVLGRE
ncbi:protein NRT1/ PTR FAMILY 6.1 [Senna tora]|uniref:Protein NRT1/ PTR FAMILY 6.1 n=1 Tax=Senna tora TaxID=362788 RepID=A0A834WXX8_9FABA|nr:protein NRT1/ PTR FAMILY 6.1 [Senna tora]